MIHGGAGTATRERAQKKLPILEQALDLAWQALQTGKPGEHAVAAALGVMEQDEHFNAGFGGYPNIHGIVLLDIGMMRGDRSFISLLNVRRIKQPSAAALDMLKYNSALMTVWTHEMMQQVDGAPEFLKERYGWVGSHEEMIAPSVRELIEKNEALEVSADPESKVGGTVGCVVRDAHGHICAGTSTGGVHLKHNGRIGDTPIIGSGVFADDEIGGLSTTGHGESMLLSQLSGFTIGQLREELRRSPEVFLHQKGRLKEILSAEIDELDRKAPGRGGAIMVVPPAGAPAWAFNTEMVSIGYRWGAANKIECEGVSIEYKDGTYLHPGSS
jgi:beta-aspartyl-peptidase (threonine type)